MQSAREIIPFRCLLLLCFVLATHTSAFASSVVQRPITDIAKQSPLVFEGRVAAIAVEAQGKKIFTWVTFEVIDVIKGEHNAAELQVRYLGGSSGGRSVRVSDQSIPAVGEHGIYFLESDQGHTVHPLRGWGQGHFILEREPSTREYFVKDSRNRTVKSVAKVNASALKLDARTAAGVTLMQPSSGAGGASDASGAQQPLTRAEFKAFIQEHAQ